MGRDMFHIQLILMGRDMFYIQLILMGRDIFHIQLLLSVILTVGDKNVFLRMRI